MNNSLKECAPQKIVKEEKSDLFVSGVCVLDKYTYRLFIVIAI